MDNLERKLKPTDRKILKGIFHLRELGYEPTVLGLSSYLVGRMSEENSFLKDDVGFGSLSCSGKKIKNKVNILVRYGYVKLSYDEKLDETFLFLSSKGVLESSKTELTPKPKKSAIHFRKIAKE